MKAAFAIIFLACQIQSSSAARKKLSVHAHKGDSYATRYWDCCKSHCSWTGNTYGKTNPHATCNKADQKQSNPDIVSACVSPGVDSAFVCHDNVPWAVNEQLAYGYAAVPAQGDICGKCYELSFTGNGKYGANHGAAALQGKKMIVQASNIGYDVAHEQFDVMIPGGGVGAFDACSYQWDVSTEQLGVQYGGFLSTCQNQHGHNAGHQVYKDCVKDKCDSVFANAKFAELKAGCYFFVDWYQVADNPTLTYHEVACPPELTQKSGMNRTDTNSVGPAPAAGPTPTSPEPTPTPEVNPEPPQEPSTEDQCCHGLDGSAPDASACGSASLNCQQGWCAVSRDRCEGPCTGTFCPATAEPVASVTTTTTTTTTTRTTTPAAATPAAATTPEATTPPPASPSAGTQCCHGPPGAACGDEMWSCQGSWCAESQANCEKNCGGTFCNSETIVLHRLS